jgi:hypothetical protein
MATMSTTLAPPRTYRFRDGALAKTAAALRQQLQSQRFTNQTVKIASGLGGDPEQSFEQSFASLAFSYVKDKAPRLLDFVKGFQLIERNEDNTRAVGVFGFQLDDGTFVYAPVFFLNGDLKGHELMFLKDRNTFLPLKENWINYLMSRKPHMLGRGNNRSARQLGILSPDVASLSRPPTYAKRGSAAARFQPWFQPHAGDFAQLITTPLSQQEKFAGLDDRLSLPVLCSRNLWALQLVKAACDQYPEINSLCNQFYGQGWLLRAGEQLQKAALAPPAPARPNLLGEFRTCSPLLGGIRAKQASGTGVEIRTTKESMADLDADDQFRLNRDGYLIRDYRPQEKISATIDLKSPVDLLNPDVTGKYDVLVQPADLEELLIIRSPLTSSGRQNFATAIRLDGGKNWLNAPIDKFWTKPQTRSVTELGDWYEGLSQEESLSEDAIYVILVRDEAGGLDGTCPFRVTKSLGEGVYKVDWESSSYSGHPMPLPRAEILHREFDRDFAGDSDTISFRRKPGVAFRAMQGVLLIPDDFRVIKIAEMERDESGCCVMSSWSYQSKTPPIRPGVWADITLQILGKTAELKLYNTGSEVSINNGPPSSGVSGLVELVRDYGFREPAARELLKTAHQLYRHGKPALFRVKYANEYPLLHGGPNAPEIPEAEYGYDQSWGGQTQYPQEDFREVPELSAQMTDPSVYDTSPENMMSPQDMQQAAQAGQMGQKEVFDTSMLSGLLKAVRQDSMVGRYTPDLMKALDRLGRLLFQFYWHNDDFSDRYGKADVPELEDSLRNTFEQLGDLVLFLKEKSVDSVLQSRNISEPDIQDTND